MAEYERGNRGDSSPSKITVIKPNRANQAAGALILLLLAGVLWIYGYAGEIRNATTQNYPTTGLTGTPFTQTVLGNLYIMASIFVVIGFGLLLSYLKRATFSALFTSIVTVSLTVIVSPIFEKFWFNIFITNFDGASPTPNDPSRFLQYSLGGQNIYIDFYNLRIVMANAISQLVTALALFGRLNPAQIILNSFGFNFCWNLNYFLCAFLATDSPDSRFMDDYQINSIYLFAACYGIIASLILKQPATSTAVEFSSSSNSAVTAHLGTFFLFLAFCTTTPLFTTKYTSSGSESQRAFIWQEAFISTFIALSASVIANYAISVLLNHKAKLGIRGSLVGTITGAIIYGPVAGTCINIGAAIACGLIAGSISAFFFEKIFPSLNGNTIKDSFGLVGVLIVSFLGTFVISPTVLKTYYNYDVDLPTLHPDNTFSTAYAITNKNIAGWVLVYVGVSAGIGLVSGLVIGLLVKFIDQPSIKSFDDSELFKSGIYGLREPITNKTEAQEGMISAQELNHN